MVVECNLNNIFRRLFQAPQAVGRTVKAISAISKEVAFWGSGGGRFLGFGDGIFLKKCNFGQ